MSELSEEEIIEYFYEVISWYKKYTPDRVYALNNKDIELIQGLLDLYKQEKEKNKELYEIKYIASTFIEKPMKQFSVGEFRYKVNNSISKDKIKGEIEEINNEKLNYSEDEYYLENEIKGYAIDKLKELLGD